MKGKARKYHLCGDRHTEKKIAELLNEICCISPCTSQKKIIHIEMHLFLAEGGLQNREGKVVADARLATRGIYVCINIRVATECE